MTSEVCHYAPSTILLQSITVRFFFHHIPVSLCWYLFIEFAIFVKSLVCVSFYFDFWRAHCLTKVKQSSICQRDNQMIPTIHFAVFVQQCKAAQDVRNLPLCNVFVALLLPSWCCKAQLLTIYLADPCRFDEIFQTKFFSHTTSFYRIWASDACAACLLCSDAVWTAAVKTDQPITVGIFFST